MATETLEQYCSQFANVTAIQNLARDVWYARQSNAAAMTCSVFGVALALNQWKLEKTTDRERELRSELISAPAAGGE